VCVCVCRCSCADAVCTIAASTTFSEPFVTQIGHRRLDWVHKNLAGIHCSDHVALLHAFQLWEDARSVCTASYHSHIKQLIPWNMLFAFLAIRSRDACIHLVKYAVSFVQ